MNILFIGDVTGKAGVGFVTEQLPSLQKELAIDLVVANCENAAANGRGLSVGALEALYDAGVEMVTLGNHVWDQREIYQRLNQDERLCRPANFHESVPGRGFTVCSVNSYKVAVVNLIGRAFMGDYDSPFATIDKLVTELQQVTPFILVDFHAEATSEKISLGWYLDGKVSAVVGTHTHVQTADERVLPGGTAYITDVGMTGPRNGVIGVKKELMVHKFLTQMPFRHELEDGARQFSAVLLTLAETGRAVGIKRIYIGEE